MTDVRALADMDPEAAADELVRSHEDDIDWLLGVAEALRRRLHQNRLQQIIDTWRVPQSDLAEGFGVTRQALAKWLQTDVPSDRLPGLMDLVAATEVLRRHLKSEAIPAVVRRQAPAFGGRSLLDMLRAGEFRQIVEAANEMFDFSRVGT